MCIKIIFLNKDTINGKTLFKLHCCILESWEHTLLFGLSFIETSSDNGPSG